MTGGWGKAGQRLTPGERQQRTRARAAANNEARHRADTDLARAHTEWAAGRVQPHTITALLDRHNLHGPHVDIALCVMEPTVDWWEAGILYPTWQDVLNLAELCGVTPAFITRHRQYIDPNMVFICPPPRDAALLPPPLTVYTPEVIAATVQHPR